MFYNFCKKFANQNGHHFWQVKYSLKLGKARLHRYPVGQKFCKIALSCTVFVIQKFLCFAIFCEKFENSKWLPFLAGQNYFLKLGHLPAELPCRSKFSPKSLYLARFLRYKHFCVLHFSKKIQNSKLLPFFGK